MRDLERLEEVLDAYGASPDRWPEQERGDLLALVERSSEARALHDAAAQFDAVLDRATDLPPPSSDLVERLVARAPQGDRSRGAEARRPASRVLRWAPLVPIAAAAMLALWIARAPDSRPLSPVPPAPGAPIEIAMADLGTYTTPTDVLLSLDGFDPLAAIPSYDCESDGLGCIDLDFDTTETHSLKGDSRRMRT